jgi:hypothetical protein
VLHAACLITTTGLRTRASCTYVLIGADHLAIATYMPLLARTSPSCGGGESCMARLCMFSLDRGLMQRTIRLSYAPYVYVIRSLGPCSTRVRIGHKLAACPLPSYRTQWQLS